MALLGHLTWPLNPPKKQPKKNKTKKTKTNKEPPRLTLKHSKKNKKRKKKGKQKQEKPKNTQKWAFQLSVKIFLFWGGVQNFPFLTTWPKKRAPPKHYKNRGFSNLFLEENICVMKRPFLDQKPKIQKFQYHFFWLLSFLQQRKTQKIAETPIL